MKKAATLMLSVFLLCAGLLLVPPKAEATGPPGKVITIEKKCNLSVPFTVVAPAQETPEHLVRPGYEFCRWGNTPIEKATSLKSTNSPCKDERCKTGNAYMLQKYSDPLFTMKSSTWVPDPVPLE